MGHASASDWDHAWVIGTFNLIAVEPPFKIYSKVPVAFVDGKTELEFAIVEGSGADVERPQLVIDQIDGALTEFE